MTASPTDDLASAERRIQELTKELSRARGELSQARGELAEAREQQAAIAEENARLFGAELTLRRELAEALERQTATSDVLGVISSSPTDVQPVFGAILDCAVRLCGADQGAISRVEDGQLVMVEVHPNTPEVWALFQEHYPRPPDTTSITGRAGVEARGIRVPDLEAPNPLWTFSLVKQLGIRNQLSVPLVREGESIGVISLHCQRPGAFSPSQIALVETFADQAVIAIEN